nr:retrovirus-related Pol polyprotein from transposon TNT 1-94 [Tanacetum cinerariifolium]
MVNSFLKKLKFHLASFDIVLKERTTATAITEGTWGFEHTKDCFHDEIIPFVKNLKELFTSFDQCLIDEVTEVQKTFKQMELANLELDHKVTKLAAENNHLKQTYKQLFDSIKSSRVQTREQCDDLINKVNLKSVEVADLNASLQEKVLVITALKEQLKVPKLRKNKTAHIDYIRHTQEEAATLKELVESERLLSPFNTSLAYAYSRATSSVIKSVSNVNLNLKCASCNGCLFSDNHDACVVEYINSVNASRKSKSVKSPIKRKVVQIVLWYLDSGCSKHMTGDRSQLINFVQMFLGTVKLGNDHVAKIMGYGDYQIGNVTIS